MTDLPERLIWVECIIRFVADALHSVIELVKELAK